MNANQSGEGQIRAALVEADLVDCMIALPGQLFFSTQIPACLWFLARDKGEWRPWRNNSPKARGWRRRSGRTCGDWGML
jgi:type I restriction enzyme M protein